jgi:hypothetical protein
VNDLEALVQVHPDVIEAVAEHISATSLVNQLSADTDALRQRGDMLKLLRTAMEQERLLKTGM